jgi:TRAP-type mannitol/chloroaromatic compound transport system permease small subunit
MTLKKSHIFKQKPSRLESMTRYVIGSTSTMFSESMNAFSLVYLLKPGFALRQNKDEESTILPSPLLL